MLNEKSPTLPNIRTSTNSLKKPIISTVSSTQTLLSIIIPTYQEEKILPILKNVYTKELKDKYNFEVIISDGGSTDKTLEIAKEFADKIYVHKENRRQTIAEGRNKGAELAQGCVLIFINADTIPKDLDIFFSYIRNWADNKNSPYQALCCWVYSLPQERKFRDFFFYSFHNNYIRFLNFIGIGMGRGECQIIRKDIFNKIGGYNPELVAGEDYDLFKRIAKIAKIKFERKLVVLESPRRFRKYGYIKTILFWIMNSLSVDFRGKSASKEWEVIR
ncbi:MAG TPA: glycosyltransferase [Candidatus Kapabacteria bacterium]|jgi:glycosyltransferase involved in cell wall biosynthesis|nr:glycosyltransferase [Candidatus Kapabacteria bacterium]HOV92719.1 glycosyltransferase [Candidatus Kapabacteria bacterium]